MKAQYFLKSTKPGPLSMIFGIINETGIIKKSDPTFSSLDIEYKYQLVRLASMGFLKFDKDSVILNLSNHGDINPAHIH